MGPAPLSRLAQEKTCGSPTRAFHYRAMKKNSTLKVVTAMEPQSGGVKKRRFRRISRARIFEGDVLKPGIYALTVMVTAYLLIASCLTILFSYLYNLHFSLFFWAVLPGALLGSVLLVMERGLARLKEYMFYHMGKLLTAFLLFFAHTIGYLALSSLLVSYPLGYVMEKLWAMPGMAGEYSLFSVNFFIVLAILSWLRNMRALPCRCF